MELLFPALLPLLLLSSPSSSSSRTLPYQTTILDVKTSIHNTRFTPSSNPNTIHPHISSSPPRSPFKMDLHSRHSLQNPTHKDYKELTLARLERDSARVSSLHQRIFTSDLEPEGLGFKSEDLQSPIVSGVSQGSGEYFSRVGIGKPSSQVYMVIDTGSDVNWLQCAPCAACYRQADPIFEPASSASYSPLSCKAKQCQSLDISQCHNGTCLYQVSYGDGSYTVGDFVTETITLGSASLENVAIGCGHNNEGLFIGAAGLLGLGGGSLSFPSQINATTFSYCFVDRDSDSASTLDFNTPLLPNAVTAPLLRNHHVDTFYYIGLTGFAVGGEDLTVSESTFKIDESGNGGIIIDSGTAITRLQTDVYNSLRDAFVKGTKHLPSTDGVALFDTCYDLSKMDSVEVPTVSFGFPSGKMLPLPAKNYLIPVDSEGTFCFAFAPTGSQLSIIGNVQQQGTRVSYDIANSLIGFESDKC
ncbi:Eukaryotic aspartyl protease family protein [Euphorbia peplus]|nr:Eukaryotic aspartyl protease family protein [Euphorbia peplus]